MPAPVNSRLKRGNDEDNHPAKDTRERSGLCLHWHPRLFRARVAGPRYFKYNGE